MVCHPVQEDLHAEGVGTVYEVAEVVRSAEFLVDALIVAYGVVRAERAFATLDADGVDGHEPYGVDAYRAKEGQTLHGSSKRTLGGKLSHVKLVEHCRVAPFGIFVCH